jgi:hypothetical protein
MSSSSLSTWGPDHIIVISPSEKNLPARLNMDIIRVLQTQVAPTIFTPRAVYDGRKNMFAARELPFGDTGQQEVGTSSIHFKDITEDINSSRLVCQNRLQPTSVVHKRSSRLS